MHTNLAPENGANAERRQDADMVARRLAIIRHLFGDEVGEHLSRRMKVGELELPELLDFLAENKLDTAIQEFLWGLAARAVRQANAEDFKLALLIVVFIRQGAMAGGRSPEN